MTGERDALVQTLEGLRGRCAASSEGPLLVSRLDACLDTVKAGEEGVALEILFDNLFEFDISLSAVEATSLMLAAERFGTRGPVVDLVALHDAVVSLGQFRAQVARRAASWAAGRLRSQVTLGQPTDKPAAWLNLASDLGEGQMTLWVSGEVELEWAFGPDGRVRSEQHREITTEFGITLCLDDLEHAITAAG